MFPRKPNNAKWRKKMNNAEKLKKLKSQIDEFKSEKIRKEEQLKALRKQRDEIVAEIESLGYTPENLEDKITELKQKIDLQLAEIEEKLSKVEVE